MKSIMLLKSFLSMYPGRFVVSMTCFTTKTHLGADHLEPIKHHEGGSMFEVFMVHARPVASERTSCNADEIDQS